MRFRTALSLATLFLVCFTIASWSTAAEPLEPTRLTAPPDNASQSGKISSIGDAAFTLEFIQGQDRKTMAFQIDGDTKFEGKLEVGSKATVEYHSKDGINMAVHVVVTPARRIGTL